MLSLERERLLANECPEEKNLFEFDTSSIMSSTTSIANEVKEKLESDNASFYPTSYVEVIDNTAGHSCDSGAKLEVIVVSDKFQDVALLQRHRMVNECLSVCMPKIHALNIKAWTSQQYETRRVK